MNISAISIFEFPVSLLLGAAVILFVLGANQLSAGRRLIGWLSNKWLCIAEIAVCALVIAVDGTWKLQIERTWPFLALMLLLMLSVGATTVRRFKDRKINLKEVGFFLTHAGFFFVIWAAFFGAADVTKYKVVAYKNKPVSVGYTLDGARCELPFSITLKNFSISRHKSGMPRQFTSKLKVESLNGGEVYDLKTSVNNPAKYEGFYIYQDSYGIDYETYSILLLVKDPWLWVIYTGFVMVFMGSVIMVVRRGGV